MKSEVISNWEIVSIKKQELLELPSKKLRCGAQFLRPVVFRIHQEEGGALERCSHSCFRSCRFEEGFLKVHNK